MWKEQPNRQDDYIPMDAVRRPYPYELREQRERERIHAKEVTEDDMDVAGLEPYVVKPEQTRVPDQRLQEKRKRTWRDFLTVSNLLILINVIVYLVVMHDKIPGDSHNANLIWQHGGLYVPSVQEDGEYYRFFTAMFLHFDMAHIMNNMFFIYVVGNTIEPLLGKMRLLLVYIISGLSGNIASYFYYVNRADYPVSAGASGAAYALFGGFLAMVMFDSRMRGRTNPWLIAIMAVVSIGSQFSDSSVGNVAHVVGFLTGFVVTMAMYLVRQNRQSIQG